jgi:hypothetical protein
MMPARIISSTAPVLEDPKVTLFDLALLKSENDFEPHYQ